MGKFAVACPRCGKYVTAHTGIRGLFQRTVDCTCGNVIDVQAERMTATRCKNCGNTVVYDSGSAKKRKCPVCGDTINLGDTLHSYSFRCPQCSLELSTQDDSAPFTCPVCDCHIENVRGEIDKKKIADDGRISTIRFEGDEKTIVFKHPIEDFRCGTQVTVHESQEAIFFRDGEALDTLTAGRYTLETQLLPAMDRIYKIPTDGVTPFHSEVYFINIAEQMGVKWGTPQKVSFPEPETGAQISLGARGTMNYKVVNGRKLLKKVVGTTTRLNRDDLTGEAGTGIAGDYFVSLLRTGVSSELANAIIGSGMNILQLDQNRMALAEALKARVNPYFAEYGIEITSFLITGILPPVPGEVGYETYQTLLELNQRKLKTMGIENQTLLGKAQAAADAELVRAEREKKLEAQRTEQELALEMARNQAEIARLQNQVELEKMAATAQIEAQEMQMKGYTGKDMLQAEVMKAWGENQVAGGTGMAGAMGGVMAMGAEIGVMGSMAGTFSQMMGNSVQAGRDMASGVSGEWTCSCGAKNSAASMFCGKCGSKKPAPAETWDCPVCGAKGITANFCGQCGAKKPAPADDSWDCACGAKGITANFCGQCGAKRPEKPATWDCACGNTGVSGNFCPNCGAKRITLPATWDCACGNTGITGNFCPNCGSKRS